MALPGDDPRRLDLPVELGPEAAEQEEIRRLVVAQERAGIPDRDVILRGHQSHHHEDLGELLAAAPANGSGRAWTPTRPDTAATQR